MTDVIQQPCHAEDEVVDVENVEYALVASLLSHLECPVCYEVNEPPIYMCQNGHIVCHICKIHMKECATCRTPGEPAIRNRFAEQTYEALTVPCAYAGRGCTARTLPQRRCEHELECGHAPIGCAVCEFAGAHKDLVEHLELEHPEVELINVTTQSARRVPLETFHRISAVIHDATLFWFHERYDEPTNSFAFQLYKSGPFGAKDSDYFCALRFSTDDLQDELSFRYPIPRAAESSCAAERGVSGTTLDLLANGRSLRYVLGVCHRDEEKERIASKIQMVTSAIREEEEPRAEGAWFFMMPLLFFFVVGCFKGWWQTLLSWH